MIRISAGSAVCLGLKANKMDAYPTTAYFLSGNSCRMGCSFCPQSMGNNGALNRLGRVNWPEFSWEQVKEGLSRAEKNGIRRICLQSVRHEEGIDPALELIEKFKDISNLPLSLSAWIKDQQEAAALFKAGADRISVAIDAINPEGYQRFKGGSQEERLGLLFDCARNLPGKMSTHLICGLGESENEALGLVDRLLKAGVTVALFAFVPLKGTLLEGGTPPPVDSYRRVQAGLYLLREKLAEFNCFKFNEQGRLISFGLPETELQRFLATGAAFQTSGCPGCNRPYYNERPGGIIYNYHRALSASEREAALTTLIKSLQKSSNLS